VKWKQAAKLPGRARLERLTNSSEHDCCRRGVGREFPPFAGRDIEEKL